VFSMYDPAQGNVFECELCASELREDAGIFFSSSDVAIRPSRGICT
jgi:hypothetical protein